jgi:hypothetical protein
MASGKDEVVADVKRLLAERDKLASGEREALLADLHQLADEHGVVLDVMACDELFANTADAFQFGVLVGREYPRKGSPDAIAGSGQPVRMTPPLPAVEQRPGPHADDWRKPLEG